MASIINVDQINEATSGNGVQIPGHVVQVKQAVTDATWSVTSTTMTDVTGLSVSITPSATSSKILVIVDAHIGYNVYAGVFHLLRDTTKIYAGDGGLTRCGLFSNFYYSTASSQYALLPLTANYLDSPATTSSLTYKLQGSSYNSSYTTYLNRTHVNINESNRDGLTASSITVMEIAQ
tara:strand:+ start:548 stop:1081 length:534 start_codon:yes stop_codon:yes gene_type:complete